MHTSYHQRSEIYAFVHAGAERERGRAEAACGRRRAGQEFLVVCIQHRRSEPRRRSDEIGAAAAVLIEEGTSSR